MTDVVDRPTPDTEEGQTFEVCALVSVVRSDEKPLEEKDRDGALDRIALAIGDASDDVLSFLCGVSPVEEEVMAEVDLGDDVEEETVDDVADEEEGLRVRTGRLISPGVPPRECVACRVSTTLVDVSQCPSCGNPFT